MSSLLSSPRLLRRLAALIAAGLLSSCAQVINPLPQAWENIQLSAVSSSRVEALTPRIRIVAGEPVLDGSVRRAYDADTTTGQVVEIIGYDQAGHAVLQQTVPFAPAELRPRSSHPYNEGTYRFSLAHAPAGLVRLEVRIVPDRPATS